jgi:hypothetical protein
MFIFEGYQNNQYVFRVDGNSVYFVVGISGYQEFTKINPMMRVYFPNRRQYRFNVDHVYFLDIENADIYSYIEWGNYVPQYMRADPCELPCKVHINKYNDPYGDNIIEAHDKYAYDIYNMNIYENTTGQDWYWEVDDEEDYWYLFDEIFTTWVVDESDEDESESESD